MTKSGLFSFSSVRIGSIQHCAQAVEQNKGTACVCQEDLDTLSLAQKALRYLGRDPLLSFSLSQLGG